MDPITIRLADPADAEFLVRGNATMALETEHLSLDLDRLRDGVHALFEDTSRGVYYLAEVKGRRVGQMMITYEWSDWRNGMFWWIQSVWVEPEFRGQGIFKALYAHVEQLARADAGVCGLRLYVEQDNERAQGTYVRCGMKRTAYQMFEADFVLNRTE
ncbi:GNAT family N-acetyltransferase [Paludibaculum fermentans]|uniref:GNAT family N-acetyltransferase n=1 Tax=Paludibaculum fermentans TaxID=1473598 RepID=A0A7S7SL04_PALFE|nr:GNAT family N-acetyltransferase [Paludibaculum fermentans]QOY89722.1 GNAT family N-acetyltransferase [Paludibaculum fermentans]